MKYWFFTLLAGWLSMAQAEVFDNDLLPVEQAFVMQAELITGL